MKLSFQLIQVVPRSILILSYRKTQFSSVTHLCPTLRPHESPHARPPCPSQTPRVYSNSCPSSRWCHPAISSSGVPFSSCPQSLPASGSFPMNQLFTWDGQITGVSVWFIRNRWTVFSIKWLYHFIFILATNVSCFYLTTLAALVL